MEELDLNAFLGQLIVILPCQLLGDICRRPETTLKGHPDNGDSVYKRTNVCTNQTKFIWIYRKLSKCNIYGNAHNRRNN